MATTTKTYYVLPAGGNHWAVKKAGSKSEVYRTQGEAIKAATRLAKRESEAQVVLMKPGGKFVVKEVRGLPVVQDPPRKSSLGTNRIAKAISQTLNKRLKTA